MADLLSSLAAWSLALSFPVPGPAASQPIAAQDEAAQWTLATHWSSGDRYALKLFVEAEESYEGKKRRADAVATQVEVEVTTAGEAGYELTWTFGESEVKKKTRDMPKELYAARARRDTGLVVRLRADPNGRVLAITNLADVRQHYVKRMAEIRGDLDANAWDDLRFGLLSGYLGAREELGESELEALLLSEISPFYAYGGLELARKGPTETSLEIPGPFDGSTLPCEATYRVKRFDERRGEAVFVYERALDRKRTKATLLERLVAEAEREGRPKPRASDVPEFVSSEEAAVRWDLNLGLPIEVRVTREMTVATSGSVVELSFERTKSRQD